MGRRRRRRPKSRPETSVVDLDALRRRECLGKNDYASALDAHRVRRIQEEECGAGELVVYRCRFCDAWHLGHAS